MAQLKTWIPLSQALARNPSCVAFPKLAPDREGPPLGGGHAQLGKAAQKLKNQARDFAVEFRERVPQPQRNPEGQSIEEDRHRHDRGRAQGQGPC